MATDSAKNPKLWTEGHLSFSGGGFVGIYQVGVAIAFKEFAPHIASRKVLGTSSGALTSLVLAADYPVDKALRGIAKMVLHCRSLSLGPVDPRFNMFDIMKDELIECMPEKAHFISKDKLYVSVTRATSFKNELMCNFKSREDLIDAVVASCFIPYFLGVVPPKVYGKRYIDGGFTNNFPVHDEHTITVSPFTGCATIAPQSGIWPNTFFTPRNFVNLKRTMFSPSPQTLVEICQEGFRDALNFISENDLFACDSCALSAFRPDRNSCNMCKDLISEAQTARIKDDHLWAMHEAAAFEDEKSNNKSIPTWLLSQTVNTAAAIAYYPLSTCLSVLQRAYSPFERLIDTAKRSTWTGYSEFSNYAQQLLSSSSRDVCGAPGSALDDY